MRAADYFRGSLAQAEKAKDASASARALANIGHLAARRDDFRAASAESMRALRLAQEAGDRMAQARLHVNLGHYLARLGRVAEAEESYRAAQAFAAEIGGASADDRGFVVGARSSGSDGAPAVLRVELATGALRELARPKVTGTARAPRIDVDGSRVVVGTLSIDAGARTFDVEILGSDGTLSPLGVISQALDE